jgi:hypothetical protein
MADFQCRENLIFLSLHFNCLKVNAPFAEVHRANRSVWTDEVFLSNVTSIFE